MRSFLSHFYAVIFFALMLAALDLAAEIAWTGYIVMTPSNGIVASGTPITMEIIDLWWYQLDATDFFVTLNAGWDYLISGSRVASHRKLNQSPEQHAARL